jgi:hypothetical protein
MKVITCGKCGFSLVLSRVIRFNKNGTITLFLARDFRVSMIEADFFGEVFERIEQELGLPIMHIVYETQRNASYESIDRNIWGPLNAGRWFAPGKRVAVNILCRIAAWTGQGYAKTVVYKPGWLGEAIVRNPFNQEMMAAVVVGAFEAVELRPFSHTWYKMGDDDVISVRPEPSRPEIAERLTFTTPPAKRGNRRYPRCPLCRMPADLNLSWDGDQGIIMDTRRGVRMVFLDAYTPKVVFREMAAELGEEIYPIIIDAQRAFSLRHLNQEFLAGGEVGGVADKSSFYLAVLDTLALRGQGNPVDFNSSDGRMSVVIENPFEEHLLAGTLAAMYELGEGRQADVAWKELDPSTLEFTLEAK